MTQVEKMIAGGLAKGWKWYKCQAKGIFEMLAPGVLPDYGYEIPNRTNYLEFVHVYPPLEWAEL